MTKKTIFMQIRQKVCLRIFASIILCMSMVLSIVVSGLNAAAEEENTEGEDQEYYLVDDHPAYMKGYPDGSFRPDDYMTRAEVTQMFYDITADVFKEAVGDYEAGFADVSGDEWYADAINCFAAFGVVNGVGDNLFEPERNITRAELIVISMRIIYMTDDGKNIFSDIYEGEWYYKSIVAAIYNGWLIGYGDGTFRPDNAVTRAEVAVIVNRMTGCRSDEECLKKDSSELIDFSDVAEDHWAYSDIIKATNSHTKILQRLF